MSGNNPPESETMISLQWNCFDNFILKGLKDVFASAEEFSDVTLICENGRAFKAHKLILSMWSPYFRDIFLNHSCDHPVIILRETKSEDIQVILSFIYEGQALLRPENENRILDTAVSLQIAGFTNVKEPTAQGSSTPAPPAATGSGSGSTQYLNVNMRSGPKTSGSVQPKPPQQQQRHTIIGISPISFPTAVEESRRTPIVVETPKTPPSKTTTKTQVYKPHKRQKIELTPTKSPVTTPTKVSKIGELRGEEQNLTTMYSLDQQKVFVADQEIPRCSAPAQELQVIEIINISPEQSSLTLGELHSAPQMESVTTEASYIYTSTSPASASAQLTGNETQVQAVALSVPGTSTNHGEIKLQHEQMGNGKRKTLSTDESQRVPCPKCGKVVKQTSLRVHISRTHLEAGTILVCPICSKPINSKGVYYKHMFLHRQKELKSAGK